MPLFSRLAVRVLLIFCQIILPPKRLVSSGNIKPNEGMTPPAGFRGLVDAEYIITRRFRDVSNIWIQAEGRIATERGRHRQPSPAW